ncbi:anthrax toxin-like adenylyl cyclase domain-containing protein [Vibrio jasicida]|uniref:anthrax toxin-like adenylyl cyclase domain-containing protein n=1 Tax=Vibrio jasicida TaxID=766224 RepID=UPI0009E6276B|nr:anthrax toxin-like adenylyl cyclase domain-containing protein [Vibrio jasicida]
MGKRPKRSGFFQAGYRPVEGGFDKKEEKQENLRERAYRQKKELRAELTFTESDEERWRKNRERAEIAQQNKLLFANEFDVTKLLYASAFQKTADKYGVVIGLRAPSVIGQKHLELGHPSKNFHVKAKSSNAGPTSGFITEKALYSKVSESNWDKHDKNIKDAISKGAKLVELNLQDSQIIHLLEKNEMNQIRRYKYIANYHGKKVEFNIDAKGFVYDEDGPVKVLTNPPEIEPRDMNADLERPITADYDLFTIIGRPNQVNIRPLTIPPRYIGSNKLLVDDNDLLKPKPTVIGASENPDKGNVHFYGTVLIDFLNKEIKNDGYNGGTLVWHNDESGNPFSPGYDEKDTPIFFIPKEKARQVFNRTELDALYIELKAMGYNPEMSPRF